jgi:hypothetical protein
LTIDCISEEFIEYLLQELEEDYDEHYNMLVCRLSVPLRPPYLPLNPLFVAGLQLTGIVGLE